MKIKNLFVQNFTDGNILNVSKRDDFESRGIGLTIVSKIIRNNGGIIRRELDTEKGAKFYFTIINNSS